MFFFFQTKSLQNVGNSIQSNYNKIRSFKFDKVQVDFQLLIIQIQHYSESHTKREKKKKKKKKTQMNNQKKQNAIYTAKIHW